MDETKVVSGSRAHTRRKRMAQILVAIVLLTIGSGFGYLVAGQLASTSNDQVLTLKDSTGKAIELDASRTTTTTAFPANDVVLYGGKTIGSSYTKTSAGDQSWTVLINSTDSAEKVTSQIKDFLKDKKWTIESQTEAKDAYSVAAAKEKYRLTITQGLAQNGDPSISYSLTAQP